MHTYVLGSLKKAVIGCRKDVMGHDNAQTSRSGGSGGKRKKHLSTQTQTRPVNFASTPPINTLINPEPILTMTVDPVQAHL
jgi:hypothetical protein